MQTDPKHRLPTLLANILAKRSALFLQKLILFEPDLDSSQHVRHYDYDCEGIQILAGFFKKKQQSILLKTFNSIRTFPSLPPRRLSTTERKQWNGTTRRTNLNSTFTASEGTPVKYAGLSTIRSKENDENHLQRSAVGEGSKKLH
jgi:hypothetical protein